MTLADLQLFVAVCEAGNLSDVARELGCTQPAVSQRVRRLERELGSPLLERRPRGVAATEAGRALYAGLVDGLEAIASAMRRVEQLRDGDAGSLRIATGGTAVKHFMSRAVARFRRRHPNVSLEFQSANSTRRCLEALRNEGADLAWITMGADTPGIEQYPAVSMPWTLVGRAGDPFVARKRINAARLKGMRYIPLREEAVSQSQLASALGGLELDATASVDDWDTAIHLVELGLGYALVPGVHGYDAAREGRVAAVRVDGLPKVAFGWAMRRRSWLSLSARHFIDALASELSKTRGVPGLEVARVPQSSSG